jgi:hypothetical protein
MLALALGLLLVLASGCAGVVRGIGGRLAVHSQAEPGTVLRGAFGQGVYHFDGKNHVTVVLLDGPAENPAQAVTIRLFWTPRAGRTPVASTATNATVHYMIFADKGERQAGVYSGAGYVYPTTEVVGQPALSGQVWQANLLLQDASAGFEDLLGQALLRGSFRARRDDLATMQTLHRLGVLVHQRLGYPRLVGIDSDRDAGDALAAMKWTGVDGVR